MVKIKTAYICQKCGFESPKWIGKCQNCNEWNSFIEEVKNKKTSFSNISNPSGVKPLLFSDISTTTSKRAATGNKEFDRVIGGGITPGSVVLIGGEPGIGKSTLLLQIALNIKDKKVHNK